MFLTQLLLDNPPEHFNAIAVMTLVMPVACLALVLIYWRIEIRRRGGRF